MRRIAFLLDQFELQSPGQQLLDRFLIGYNDGGQFKAADAHVSLFLPGGENSSVRLRAQEFGLELAGTMESALAGADAVVIATGTKAAGGSTFLSTALLERALSLLPAGAACHLDGALLRDSASLERIRQRASERKIRLRASMGSAFLTPLPITPVLHRQQVEKALIVVQGAFPQAELEAWYALEPYISLQGPGADIDSCRRLRGDDLWREAYSTPWGPLLGAAVSRSNNIKGDPDKDGRTQDIVGLRLLEKLATNGRGWIARHRDGRETFVLVVDGAVADFNFAVLSRGRISSAQLYRPQAPLEEHYSAQAQWMDGFFRDKALGTDLQTAKIVAGAVEKMV